MDNNKLRELNDFLRNRIDTSNVDGRTVFSLSLKHNDVWLMSELLDAALASLSQTDAAISQKTALSIRKDAARYRWLRNNAAGQFEHPIVVSQHHEVGKGMRYMGPVIDRELDRLIDTAIAAMKESTE